MRTLEMFIAVLVFVGLSLPAEAALKKYVVEGFTFAQFSTSSPRVRVIAGGPDAPGALPSIALIDETGASPVLKKYVLAGGNSLTTAVPELSGFIWFNSDTRSGPPANQAGTGSSASSIDWGNIAGWTLTGGTWCNAVPSLVCGLAQAIHLQTVDPAVISTNFDLATWTFHGTGFIQSGYITFTNTSGGLGNNTVQSRGSPSQDGTVPAIPLLGLGSIGLAVLAIAVTAARGGRA